MLAVQDLPRSYSFFLVHHVSQCNVTRKRSNTTERVWYILWISQIPGVCKLGEETDGKMILLKILTWLQHARCPPHAQCVRSLWGLMDLHPWALAHIKQFCQDPYVNASCYTWPYGSVLGAPWVGLKGGLPTGQIKLVLKTLCKDLPIRDIEENHHHHH